MNDRENARHAMFSRTIAFRDARPGQFTAGGKAEAEFALVADSIAAMDLAEGKQTGGKQKITGGTTNKEVLVDALRLDLSNMAITAISIGEKDNNPGYAQDFRLPDSPGEQALLNAARLFKQNATPDAAKFIAYELPDDFLDHLDADIAAIEACNKQQDAGLDQQTGGTAAIRTAIRTGLAAVGQLNSIMRNKYARDPENLRAWLSASHTERAARRAKPTTPPPPNPPAP